MATPDPLSAAARKQVARQLGPFVRGPGAAAVRAAAFGPAAAASPPGQLAEGYAQVTVGLADVLAPPADPARLLDPTGAWAHALRTGADATHLAVSRSSSFDPDDQQVLGVFAGPLPGKIDAVARWLDEHDKDDDAVVRLLNFPAFYTTAFGILRGKKASAVLIDQPADFKELKYEKEYPLKEFLTRLAREPHT